MVKVGLLGIVSVIIAINFKNNKPQYGFYISIMTCVIIAGIALNKLSVIIDIINEINEYIVIDGKYFAILIKIIGITYISDFSTQLCKDMGYSAIGSQIEMVGKLSIMVISMPIIGSLMETVNTFLS